MKYRFSERINDLIDKFDNNFKLDFNRYLIEENIKELLEKEANDTNDEMEVKDDSYNFKDLRVASFNRKLESLDSKKIKKYYLRKRILQIIDSLNNNVKKELDFLNKNKKILERNVEYLFSLRLSKETKIELIKLNTEKIIPILRLYLEFYKELKKKTDYFNSIYEKLSKEGSGFFNEINVKDLLNILYFKIKLLEDYYFDRKKEFMRKIDLVNREIEFLIDYEINSGKRKKKEKRKAYSKKTRAYVK